VLRTQADTLFCSQVKSAFVGQFCADYTVKNKVLLLQMEAIQRRRYVEGFYEVGSRMNVMLFYYMQGVGRPLLFAFMVTSLPEEES
jgi:hypothetical protein